MSHTYVTSDIVTLNVGGTRFSTSRQTLSSAQDSFFTSMLSGRIPTCRDETGALFIDRDPKLFSIILHFLRTKDLDLNGVDVSVLRHEAEFYGILPLVKRLLLCEDLDRSQCGDVLFTGFIPTPPQIPSPLVSGASFQNGITYNETNQASNKNLKTNLNLVESSIYKPGNVHRISNNTSSNSTSNYLQTSYQKSNNEILSKQQTLINANECLVNRNNSSNNGQTSSHSRNSSVDLLNTKSSTTNKISHSRNSSYETSNFVNNQQVRNCSTEIRQIKSDLGILLNNGVNVGSKNEIKTFSKENNFQVNIIVGHQNWIAIAYPHFVNCYKLKDGIGWQLMFQSCYIDEEIDRLAINSKHQLTSLTNASMNNGNTNSVGGNNGIISNNANSASTSTTSGTSSINLTNYISNSNGTSITNTSSSNQNSTNNSSNNFSHTSSTSNSSYSQSLQTQQHLDNPKLCALLAIAFNSCIRLWVVNDENNTNLIGNFSLNSPVDSLFFIGSQLVATSSIGKIGVWNSLSQLWQIQDVTPIASFDTAGSFLLLGGQNGILYYIDMQKFPLRMKDNDLLVTELYKDPNGDAITALSVYLTPKTSNTGNWIEIAYGTSTGQVRVIVQHPETVGHGPQLFQTFSVHRGSVIKVMLTEKHLVSVCSEYNHVRTWNVTRFRGMISTQPGSTPLASFKIVTIDALDSPISYSYGNDIGPFGEKDNIQVFIQKVVPYTDQLFVRLSSTGKRICTIKSVDYSMITCYCVHECEGPSRLNSRPRRYLFTGHSNGTIQLWDLTTALELKPTDQAFLGGPSPSEFVRLLDQCDLSHCSGYSTPTANSMSPSNVNVLHNFISNNSKLSKTNQTSSHIVHLSSNQSQNLDDQEKNGAFKSI